MSFAPEYETVCHYDIFVDKATRNKTGLCSVPDIIGAKKRLCLLQYTPFTVIADTMTVAVGM